MDIPQEVIDAVRKRAGRARYAKDVRQAVIRYVTEQAPTPFTRGEHGRAAVIEKVAEQLGVNKATIYGWLPRKRHTATSRPPVATKSRVMGGKNELRVLAAGIDHAIKRLTEAKSALTALLSMYA